MNSCTYSDLDYLSRSQIWRGCIDTSNTNPEDRRQTYTLHATGYADSTNGRKYVALPKNTKITQYVKKKYNLM